MHCRASDFLPVLSLDLSNTCLDQAALRRLAMLTNVGAGVERKVENLIMAACDLSLGEWEV